MDVRKPTGDLAEPGMDLADAIAQIERAATAGKLSAGAVQNLKNWLTEPAYAAFRPRILEMIRLGAYPDLDASFWEIIPFGTGGRRGRMAEVGSATINARTIAESAHGMAVYLKQVKGAGGGRAVVAHDTRNRSPEFARLTATTLAAHGLTVFLFDGHRSTPELSFAVRKLNCDLGVVISASHNPPSDNGFKAYWSSGAQVLPPHDRGIIDCVICARAIPTVDFDEAVKAGSIQIIGGEIDRAYIAAVVDLSLSKERGARAVFTPLHGVGETSVYRVLRDAGFSAVEIFEPQRQPDGNFTNVPSHLPNPELTDAFAPAVEVAHQEGSDLVLASDPDADRLGVSVRDKGGRFVHLTGNQVGALLLDYILEKRAALGTLSPEHFVCTTLVTTPQIGTIARAYGVTAVDDLLVGFKYIAQTMDERGADKFVFGVEESLGYLAGEYCRDKDAAIAALYVMERAAELKRGGLTLLDGLDQLYQKHGYFLEGQQSETCHGSRGKEQIDHLMRTLRSAPPRELGGLKMERLRDYREQVARNVADGRAIAPLATTKGDLIFLDSAPGPMQVSIAVRPSGTEPKIKFYFFAKAHRTDSMTLEELKSQTAQSLREVQQSVSHWLTETLAASGAA